MNYKKIKLELFYIRKAFLEYKNGFKYLKNKHFLAPKILKSKKTLEKPVNHNDLSVHLLTGHSHLVMCLWSLASFYRSMENIGSFYLHNDGSLTRQDKEVFSRFFPSAKIIDPNEFLERYEMELGEYPVIKKFRTQYPQYFLLKKLIDPYFVGDKNYHLIIDADLGWFKKAKELDQEIENGCQNSLIIENNKPCYVYFKDGSKLSLEAANCNSGIVLYKKENFDLKKIADYLNRIDTEKPENSHFIEQAGYATCLSKLKKLPDSYTISGKLTDNTVMKHYTSPRRPLFYTEALGNINKSISL